MPHGYGHWVLPKNSSKTWPQLIGSWRKKLRIRLVRRMQHGVKPRRRRSIDADASRVQSQADLAAFSVGLFAQQLSEISPQAARAVRSVEQMVINEIIDGKLSARANPTFRSGGRTFDITGSPIPG